jgi:hypothetical protein
VAVVAFSGLVSVRDFFGRWASAPQLFEAYSGEQVQLAQVVQNTVPKGANVALYLTTPDLPDWSLEYLLGALPLQPRLILGGKNCRFLPPHATQAAYVVVDDPAASAELKDLDPALMVVKGSPPVDVDYLPAGQAGRWPVGHLRLIHFGVFVDMAGYTLTPAAPLPGQSLQLKVIWQVNQTTPADYKIFMHLLGAPKADGSTVYAQLDLQPCGGSFPTWQWQPGDVVMATYALVVPADMPAGHYTLDLGWDDAAAALRLPVSDETQHTLGNALSMAQFQIGSDTPPSK